MLALGRFLELTLAGREPSEKIQLAAGGARLQWLAEGVLQISPPSTVTPHFDLLLSAGIHGNETAPVELLDGWLKAISSGQLVPGCRLLLILGNPEAMRRGKRFCSEDLNRQFLGKHAEGNGFEAARGAELEQFSSNFFAQGTGPRIHLDLHCTLRASHFERFAIFPCGQGQQVPEPVKHWLQALGIAALLLQERASSTFSAFTAAQCGALAFTLELGRARPFGENLHGALAQVQAQIADLIAQCVLDGADSAAPLPVFKVARELIKHSEQFRLHLPDDAPNFTPLAQGMLLAEDLAGARWLVDEAQARILFPNPKVAAGQRAGLIIVPA